MTTQIAHKCLQEGTDIAVTLKYGYDNRGIAITVTVMFRASVWGAQEFTAFANRVIGFVSNAEDCVICEA